MHEKNAENKRGGRIGSRRLGPGRLGSERLGPVRLVPGRLGSAKFWSRTGVLKNKVVMHS